MTVALRPILDYFEPAPPPEKEGLRKQLFQQYSFRTVTEIAVVSIWTGLACYFAENNEIKLAFVKKSITDLAINAGIRAVATGCRYAALVDKGLFFRMASLVTEFAAPFYFAAELPGRLIRVFVHEGGHILLSYLLFRVNKIEVVAHSLLFFCTSTNHTGCSGIGNFLGSHYSEMTCLAGGALATMAMSQASLVLGLHFFRSSQLAKYVFLTSVLALAEEFKYAKEALTATSSYSHDFVQLWKEGGLHPWAAMAAIIALPVITTAGYLFCCLKNKKNKLKSLEP